MPAKRLAHRAISGEGLRGPSGAYEVEVRVHFAPVKGQEARTLCGWDGGQLVGDTDDEVTCKECLGIYRFFRPKCTAYKGAKDAP